MTGATLDAAAAAAAKESTLPIGSVEAILERAQAGPPDAKSEVIEVPEWDCSIRVGTYTAEASAKIKGASITFGDGGKQMSIDVVGMERLQFVHGVVSPQFTESQATQLQKAPGGAAAWARVISKIDEMNGSALEEVKRAKREFPD